MIGKSLPPDEPGAQERFDQALKNALATAPKPHKPKERRESKGAKRE
jgi:hypothetical protein